MTKMGSYLVCQRCLGIIWRKGISAHKKVGRGFSIEGKNYHKHCWVKSQRSPRIILRINQYV
jgi:hypothetical protein